MINQKNGFISLSNFYKVIIPAKFRLLVCILFAYVFPNNFRQKLFLRVFYTYQLMKCSLQNYLYVKWKLQPLDVGVNKPFKDHMRQEYDDFMWDQYDTPDAERKKVEHINVAVR